jgi:hypothetical protein
MAGFFVCGKTLETFFNEKGFQTFQKDIKNPATRDFWEDINNLYCIIISTICSIAFFLKVGILSESEGSFPACLRRDS